MLTITTRLVVVLAIFALGPATALGQTIASGFGEMNVGANRIIVHATVVVPPGLDGNALAQAAIRNQGARPFQPAELTLTGLAWDQFFNGSTADDQVDVHYNPSGEPSGLDTGFLTGLTDWNTVDTSMFVYDMLPTYTTRCPSLVQECPGPQTFDGYNDLGWLSIGGCCTLAVTWYSTSIDEIDMALNTRFRWTGGNSYEAETVLRHEAGHGLGLGHSPVSGAVMEATYAGPRGLHADDMRGVTYLYPADQATVDVTGFVGSANNGSAIAGASVRIADFPASTTTDQDGNYTFAAIPKIGTYEIIATAQGYEEDSALLDPTNPLHPTPIFLAPSSGSGSGGGNDSGGEGGECVPRGNSGKCR